MKTICFVSMGELLVTKGGIHRVTYCLMNELKKRGYRCIYLFYPIDESCYYTGNVEEKYTSFLQSKWKIILPKRRWMWWLTNKLFLVHRSRN